LKIRYQTEPMCSVNKSENKWKMPIRINIFLGIVAHIRIPVPIERITWIRRKTIRLGETAQARVVPARLVVVQPGFGFQLPGVAPLRRRASIRVARRSLFLNGLCTLCAD
jgi:hypothetical protein